MANAFLHPHGPARPLLSTLLQHPSHVPTLMHHLSKATTYDITYFLSRLQQKNVQ